MRPYPLKPIVAAIMATAATLSAPAVATTSMPLVSATYAGLITQDSGLGFLGQTLRVDVSYLSNSPAASLDSLGLVGMEDHLAVYGEAITALTVSIGDLSWTSADGRILVANDIGYPFLPVSSVSDGFQIRNQSPFSGDTLSLSLSAPVYSLVLEMIDSTPFGAPDAIASTHPLPGQAPDPALFSDGASSGMAFSVYDAEDPLLNYMLVADSFSLVSSVPEPGIGALFLAGLGLVGVAAKRRR